MQKVKLQEDSYAAGQEHNQSNLEQEGKGPW